MNIAIDGINTLLGQSIAELIQKQSWSLKQLVSILHGDLKDIDNDDSQLESQLDGAIETKNSGDIKTQFFNELDFSKFDIVFIADNQDHNKLTLDTAIEAGLIVIDCAGNCRDRSDIPLIVGAINSHEMQGLKPGFVITLPTAASTMLSQVVGPLAQNELGLQRVNVCHFAPAANLGKLGVEQLAGQTARLLNGMPLNNSSPKKKSNLEQLAFNLLPQSGAIDNFAYAELEYLLMQETQRVLDLDTVVFNASVVQVPVFYAQSQIIDLQFAEPVDCDSLEALLKRTTGIRVTKPQQASPAVVQSQTEKEDIAVSRMRQNPSDECSLTLWCASDNLRRGTAGNAVQTADLLIKSYL